MFSELFIHVQFCQAQISPFSLTVGLWVYQQTSGQPQALILAIIVS
jgi:hypothetical protein